MMKRIFAGLLAGLMLFGGVSCATSGENQETQGAQMATDTAAETELTPDLPEMDYKGQAFRVLTTNDGAAHLMSSKVNGEVVNDALFEANTWVTNRFNVKFEQHAIDNEMSSDTINGYIMAGDDEYDVAYLHDCTTAGMSLSGWFLNANDLPYLNPTAPWWPRFTVESLTLNGKMYYFSNYSSYQSMAWTRACFFNESILTDFNMEKPYDSVREGTWTLDKITQMSTVIYNDLNGDGKQDTEDLLGFAFIAYPYGWLESFGIEMYKKEAADSAVLTLATDDERCYTLIEKLHTWFYSGDDSVYIDFKESSDSETMFAANRVAFTFAGIGNLAPQAVDAGISYGIVPIPKIDENQKDYYAGCNDRLYSVPTTVRDTERVGIILEAMAYAGYKYILPAYCEKTLKTRFATDPDCAEMLNLVFERQVISFAYLFANSVDRGGMQYRFIADTVERNKVSSFFKSKQRKEQKMLQTIMDFYENGGAS